MSNKFKELQWDNKWPLSQAFYGRIGALRLSLKPAYQERADDNRDKPEGCVFLELAKPGGETKYDWKNKIQMALNLSDIPKIILFLKNPKHSMFKKDQGLKIYHDPNKGRPDEGKEAKSLKFERPEGKSNIFIHGFYKKNGSSINATASVGPDQCIVIVTLLEAAIPAILSWH